MFGTLAPRFDRTMRALSLAAVVLVAGAFSAPPAKAQGLIDRVKQKVKDKTDAVTDSIADAKIDKATGAVMCAASNSACIKKATDSGKQVEIVDAKGKRVSAADSAKAMDKAGVRRRARPRAVMRAPRARRHPKASATAYSSTTTSCPATA